jgi:hypothetical protein
MPATPQRRDVLEQLIGIAAAVSAKVVNNSAERQAWVKSQMAWGEPGPDALAR